MLPTLVVALIVSLARLAVADDVYCDESVPCSLGCCGVNNVCGMGPDYCSDDKCINSCDAKAECNPGGWDDKYVNATTCPLNVCCSDYGFCGTTSDFCGDETVTRPSCDVDSQSITRVIGYYASAGASRACDGMIPEAFPQGVYSHIYFAFGSIDPDTFEVIPAVAGDEDLYPRLAALKSRDLGQELWLSIGGWDFSDSNQPTATTFSDLVGAPVTHQNVFFASLTLFMNTWGFTGVDIDWEYPAADDRNGRDADYKNFPKFLANLKKALDEYKFGLSITLPTSYWYLQHFDLASIEPSVDWFNFMSYDLHGTWDIGNEWTGAYLDAHTNLTEIETALDLLWRNDIKPSKVNLGMAFYGRSFTIASSSCTEPGCEYLSAGDAGTCSNSVGILMNSEIGDIIAENGLTPTLYKDAAVKVATWGDDQWVSYDDEETWKIKADFAKSQCIGGVLVWAVDYDDLNQTYSLGLASALGNDVNLDLTTGLTLSMKETSSSSSSDTQSDYCRFINCGETCPSGYTEIVRGDKKSQLMLDGTQCPPGSGQTQTLCCPKSSEAPTCQWRGFHNSGSCKGGCEDGEAEVGTNSAGCRSGYQSACCTNEASTKPWGQCEWTSSCESDETCPSGYSNFVVGSRNGWGGRKTCGSGKNYNYCCKDSVPDAFTNCEWVGHEVSFTNTEYCSDACPSGSIRIAEQTIATLLGADQTAHTSKCYYGAEAYCCSGATSSSSTRSVPTVYQDETAEEFDAYLKKFLAAPICPGTWDAEYSAPDPVAKRSVLDKRATDQSITLLFLLRLFSTWVTSRSPRSDMDAILVNRLEESGYGTTAANLSLIQDVLYPDSWSASPNYDPESLLADMLCNIANSANGLNSIDAATTVLCQEVEGDSSITTRDLVARKLTLVGTGQRSANGVEPAVRVALQGVVSGELSLHYLRWIDGTGNQVILEAAFWIGSEVGVLPDSTVRSRYQDSSHTGATQDRWIVFHFHITLDGATINNDWHPGIVTLDVYHSQTVRTGVPAVTLGNVADNRAEYRYSSTYSRSFNVGSMRDYNARSFALECPISRNTRNPRTRWYIGVDNAASIGRLSTQPSAYADALNEFGMWLWNQDVFSLNNMARIWPILRTEDSSFQNAAFDGQARYNPESGAFDENWLPDGTTPKDPNDAEG